MMRPLVLAAALCVVPGLAEARPSLRAAYTAVPPVIDGRLDDPSWTAAEPGEGFTQTQPVSGADPTHPTSFRVLYDHDAVYVGFHCDQRGTGVVARLSRRDREVESDWVWVALDTRGDGRSALEFAINAAGVLQDSVRYDDTEALREWDEVWEGKSHVTPDGWSAELRIPMRVFRFADRPVQEWGLQVGRYVSGLQEVDKWVFIPRDAGGDVSQYGRLGGLVSPGRSLGIQARPFVLAEVRRRDAGAAGSTGGTDSVVSGGLDAKIQLTPDSALDIAVNPDFGQVEADQVILNLTNYEVLYPEKRPFFLEGLDILATPMRIFYSRRIGRAPPTNALLAGTEQVADVPDPAPIYGAAKISAHLTESLLVGALSALTGPSSVLVQSAPGMVERRNAVPTTMFNAVRFKYKLPGNADVGAMGTAVMRFEEADRYRAAPDGSGQMLCPGGQEVVAGKRCFANTFVGGADFRWRSPKGWYSAVGQVIGSRVEDGPERVLPDGTQIRSGQGGYGALARAAKDGGPWAGSIQYEYASRRLDYDEIGFMERQSQNVLSTALEYRTLSRWWKTNETRTRVEGVARDNLDSVNLGRKLSLSSDWLWSNNWRTGISLELNRPYFDDRETGDGLAVERMGSAGAEVRAVSDGTRSIVGRASFHANRLDDGEAVRAEGGLTFRLRSNFELELTPAFVLSRGEPRLAWTDGTSYTFGRLDARSLDLTLRATYTFIPTVTLQGYAQAFVAAGHFSDFQGTERASGQRLVRFDDLAPVATPPANPDFERGAFNVNAVLRWEISPGTVGTLAYTRSQAPDTVLMDGEKASVRIGAIQEAPAADVVMMKLAYYWAR